MANDPSSPRRTVGRSFFGSARSGASTAWATHLTSVALLVLTFFFVAALLAFVGRDYAGVRATMSHPLPAIALLLFVLASAWHMKLGMQSIIDDYVHDQHLKEWALVGNFCFSAAIGLATAFAIVKLSLS